MPDQMGRTTPNNARRCSSRSRPQSAGAEIPIHCAGRWISSTWPERDARMTRRRLGQRPSKVTSCRSDQSMGGRAPNPSNRSSDLHTTRALRSPVNTRRMPMMPTTGPRTAEGQPTRPATNRVLSGSAGGANRCSPVPTIPANMKHTAMHHNTSTRPSTLTRCHSTISEGWCFVIVLDCSCRRGACEAT